MMTFFKKKEVQVFNLFERCFSHLTSTSSRDQCEKVLFDALNMYYFRTDIHFQIMQQTCFKLDRRNVTASLCIINSPDLLLIPNNMYIRLLANLILSNKTPSNWQAYVHPNSKEDKRFHIQHMLGVLVTIPEKYLLVPEYFFSNSETLRMAYV